MILANDPFLGLWRFKPEESRYEFGPMPQNATYRIEADGDAYKITMAWMADGKDIEQVYVSVPDGVDHPFESAAVDAIWMGRIDARTLDTAAKKDGEVISYATRILDEDGQVMRITMSGTTPDGNKYANLAIYERT